jgi:hypothetical protein
VSGLMLCRLCKGEPTRVDDYAGHPEDGSQGHYEIGCPDDCGVYVWSPTLEETERRWNALMGAPQARPLDEWDEDDGAALWWVLPVCEPPYVGSPLDDDFPDYVTHWTPLECPTPPPSAGKAVGR